MLLLCFFKQLKILRNPLFSTAIFVSSAHLGAQPLLLPVVSPAALAAAAAKKEAEHAAALAAAVAAELRSGSGNVSVSASKSGVPTYQEVLSDLFAPLPAALLPDEDGCGRDVSAHALNEAPHLGEHAAWVWARPLAHAMAVRTTQSMLGCLCLISVCLGCRDVGMLGCWDVGMLGCWDVVWCWDVVCRIIMEDNVSDFIM